MAATVLNSRVAIETSILVVRAFIHAREIISEHRELKLRLERLEERVARGFHDTEDELQAVRFAIQQLMDLPPPSSKKNRLDSVEKDNGDKQRAQSAALALIVIPLPATTQLPLRTFE